MSMFSKRMKGKEVKTSTPTRIQPSTMKNGSIPQFDRAKISMPVALLSTTNMLSYNAPDIATLGLRQATSPSSTHSAEDSDNSASTGRSRASSHGSRDTLTDASSVGSSPTSKLNHLSGYFSSVNHTPRRSASFGNLKLKSQTTSTDSVPAVPERALSHSKRAHERLAHKRSMLNVKPHGSLHSNRSTREPRTSLDIVSNTIQEETHPFGKELEQLNEVAEEFGGVVRDAEFNADMAVIHERGLAILCAADYLQEIKPLYHSRFEQPKAMAWI